MAVDRMRLAAASVTCAVIAGLTAACGSPPDTSPIAPTVRTTDTGAARVWVPPPAGASFDYQLGGAYQLPDGVTVVSRDREDSPAPGAYNICYVNAFQAQPGAESWWQENHPDLLLRDTDGELVIDEDWDEILLDFSTAAKRTALTTIAGEWIDRCSTDGFQALENDNLDSYTRSKNLLTQAQAILYAQALNERAHAAGLASGQKNTAELSGTAARQAGFDFAVAEECAEWDECGGYAQTYENRVLVIEYSREGFTAVCEDFGNTLSVVLRDRDVSTPGSGTYVFEQC
jgi:hypothetical protein